MENFNPQRQIAIVWGIGDIQSIRPDLDCEQSMQVLQYAKDKHDANKGINWNVLEIRADELFPR